MLHTIEIGTSSLHPLLSSTLSDGWQFRSRKQQFQSSSYCSSLRWVMFCNASFVENSQDFSEKSFSKDQEQQEG